MNYEFIEVHNAKTGETELINLNHIVRIAPAGNGQCTVDLTTKAADAGHVTTKESYDQIRDLLMKLAAAPAGQSAPAHE